MGLTEFFASGECRSRAHCAACRDEGKGGAMFRTAMAEIFSLPQWWDCPHCAKHADWCYRYHARTDRERCLACKNPATERIIKQSMMAEQRPACEYIEDTGERKPCLACGGKQIMVPVFRCQKDGREVSPGECRDDCVKGYVPKKG